MIARINESKTLSKHISCECKCKFDDRKCNSSHKWNNDKRRFERKNLRKHNVCEKNYIIWNPITCTCKNGKYLESIFADLVVIHDEIIEVTKTVSIKTIAAKTITTKINSINFNKTCKVENFCILFTFLFITISLLITVSR